MCHFHPSDPVNPRNVSVTFHIEDAAGLTGDPDKEKVTSVAAKGQHLLEAALEQGINIEHSCGGVCACSTCHVYIEQGLDDICESSEAEEDRVEEAPGLQINSRLACQCVIEGDGPIVIRIPAWNRNAIKEVPH